MRLMHRLIPVIFFAVLLTLMAAGAALIDRSLNINHDEIIVID